MTLDDRYLNPMSALAAHPPSFDLTSAVSWGLGFAIGVPRDPGIYLIYDLRCPLYIGQTGNLRRRFEEHIVDSHNSALHTALRDGFSEILFTWILVAPEELAEVERHAITTLRPLCNIHHNCRRNSMSATGVAVTPGDDLIDEACARQPESLSGIAVAGTSNWHQCVPT